MIIQTKDEFYAEQPQIEEKHFPEFDAATHFYLTEVEDCPYIGVGYADGSIWVYGAKVDCQVEDIDELEWYLEQR